MRGRLEGVFVTGTDTGVGKTRVACALVARAAAEGVRVAGLKPISAGLEPTPAGPRHADALALMAVNPIALAYDEVNPFALGEPIAPHLAAAAEGRALARDTVAGSVRAVAARLEAVVVEGVGGFVVPLGPGWDTADLAQDLGLPVVLVVGLRLGCLNHALLTREAIARRGLPFAGWVGSAIDPGFARAAENLAALTMLLEAPALGVLPHAPGEAPAATARHLDRLPPSLRKP